MRCRVSFVTWRLGFGCAYGQIEIGLDRLETGLSVAVPILVSADQTEGNQVASACVAIVAVDGDDFHLNDSPLTRAGVHEFGL